ncbi:MAG TPA: hypothetical protein VK608_06860 [Edaphobacter sp.]|nr:hypothetical protein [Edaphobacter sp.]
MLTSTCPRLNILTDVFKTAYRRRNEAISGYGNSFEIAKAEANLTNTQKLINDHRSACAGCKAKEAAREKTSLRITPPSEKTSWKLGKAG